MFKKKVQKLCNPSHGAVQDEFQQAKSGAFKFQCMQLVCACAKRLL